ncbi:hypothetical protein [Ilyobacter polytropus]|uniref:Uncharacterized protein n=1 Tax=Ilyobacter polytropus (strain ATCC 51220 / DSM 2926 / LMG 16218 / CuHBu1) TaxID=572544 RepID=E3H9R7_ILYPC|nr:hypothetical protein [Ilyobacter polytropus]ADO83596.1 hypothetical protein Ilyop_1825 [Ilyobacter polytropus DSM 2926]
MKKKGSAIVLAVLLLSFFTAISLAVFYLGGKKGERAYLKVIGEEVSNDVDMGSSIAYYDAYVSEQFVRKGKVYDYSLHDRGDDKDVYPAVSTMAVSSMSSVDTMNYVNGSTPKSGYYYLGIRLGSYINYFASNWDYRLGTTANKYYPYIAIDTFNKTVSSDPVLAYRKWQQEDDDKINRLWVYDGKWDDDSREAMTVGGYRLETLELVKDTDGVLGSGDDGDPVAIYTHGVTTSKIKDVLSSAIGTDYGSSWLVRATYVKRIRIDGGTSATGTAIGTAYFKMKAVHKAIIKFSDSDGDTNLDFEGLYADSGEVIEELIIEKM